MPGGPSTAAAACSLGGRRCTLRGDTTACRSAPGGRSRRRATGTSPSRAGNRGRGAVRERGGAARGEPAPQSGASVRRALSAAGSPGLPEVRLQFHGPPSPGAVALLPVLRHGSQPVPRPVPLRRPAGRGRAAGCGRLARGLPAAGGPGAGSDGVSAAPGRGTGQPAPARAGHDRSARSSSPAARSTGSSTATPKGFIAREEFEPRIVELRSADQQAGSEGGCTAKRGRGSPLTAAGDRQGRACSRTWSVTDWKPPTGRPGAR